jgi:AraC-like DNA-binding protein
MRCWKRRTRAASSCARAAPAALGRRPRARTDLRVDVRGALLRGRDPTSAAAWRASAQHRARMEQRRQEARSKPTHEDRSRSASAGPRTRRSRRRRSPTGSRSPMRSSAAPSSSSARRRSDHPANRTPARERGGRQPRRRPGSRRVRGVKLRALQRLFRRHVGVSPKWVIRRARVQEAAERVARGERVVWASLASELGSFDQAHLIRDFRAQVGQTPAVYAATCARYRDEQKRTSR